MKQSEHIADGGSYLTMIYPDAAGDPFDDFNALSFTVADVRLKSDGTIFIYTRKHKKDIRDKINALMSFRNIKIKNISE